VVQADPEGWSKEPMCCLRLSDFPLKSIGYRSSLKNFSFLPARQSWVIYQQFQRVSHCHIWRIMLWVVESGYPNILTIGGYGVIVASVVEVEALENAERLGPTAGRVKRSVFQGQK
jgi:hypothetical protein